MVRSNDQIKGNFTQAHIWKYLTNKGKLSETGNVPVRSCFGGITAYRSIVYLNEECQYGLDKDFIEDQKYNNTSIMRYATNKEERPCEHVVFHDCLRRKVPKFDIAVNPHLITFWQRDT